MSHLDKQRIGNLFSRVSLQPWNEPDSPYITLSAALNPSRPARNGVNNSGKQLQVICPSYSNAYDLCRSSCRFPETFPFFIIQSHPAVNEQLPGCFPGVMPSAIAVNPQLSYSFRSLLVQVEVPKLSAVPRPYRSFENNAIAGIKKHLSCTASVQRIT